MFDLALGLDGLTDIELRDELEAVSDEEDDGINVTIKEGIRPVLSPEPPQPKLASVVVPKETKRFPSDLIVKTRTHLPNRFATQLKSRPTNAVRETDLLKIKWVRIWQNLWAH